MSTVSQKVPHGYCQSVQAQGVQKWPSCDRIRTIGWGAKKKKNFNLHFCSSHPAAQHTKKETKLLHISHTVSYFSVTDYDIWAGLDEYC